VARQVNIRLPDEDVAVLEAASFLDEDGLPDLVRRILLDRVAVLRKDPQVHDALRLRAERAAAKEGTLSSLDARRSRTQAPDGQSA
jgi:hypothetical protein